MDLSTLKKSVISANYPLILLISCVLYSQIISVSYHFVAIIGVLAVLTACNNYMKEFFRLKEKVISENDFRVEVSKDIADLKNKISSVSLHVKGDMFGKRR